MHLAVRLYLNDFVVCMNINANFKYGELTPKSSKTRDDNSVVDLSHSNVISLQKLIHKCLNSKLIQVRLVVCMVCLV